MQPQQQQQQPKDPNSAYRLPDHVASKVHSIQVGNVLQIVPTEVQPTSSSSQTTKIKVGTTF